MYVDLYFSEIAVSFFKMNVSWKQKLALLFLNGGGKRRVHWDKTLYLSSWDTSGYLLQSLDAGFGL